MSLFRKTEFCLDSSFDLLYDQLLPLGPRMPCHPLLVPPPPPLEKPLVQPLPLSVLDFFHPSSIDLPFDALETSYAADLLEFNATSFSSTLRRYRKEYHFPAPAVSDLIEVSRTPFSSSVRRYRQECHSPAPASLFSASSTFSSFASDLRLPAEVEKDAMLQCLSDRISALELGLEEIFSSHPRLVCKEKAGRDVSYSYKLESEGGKGLDRKQKWTAEIKGLHGEDSRISATYKLEASAGKKEKDKKTKPAATRVVEIEDADSAIARKQELFAKRRSAAVAAIKSRVRKGKWRQLSPENAALIIQMTFRAHLVRRSQALRGLRDLAIAKAKLKELRSLFNNFSYRRRLTVDAEERQRFSEKIIVLLLTVEGIAGVDLMIREAQRNMIKELEAMLEAVDPQPAGKLASFKRRTFDLPEPCSNGELVEMAKGVAEVVQMLDQDCHKVDIRG
ncbi:BAG family molecular chaperone regulator 7 [Nymphaea thermarum]|nr:BAG family molecular chaperone regulator 7 [Nymphaea thermarum]